MVEKRYAIHAAFVLALPIVVALFGLSVASAAGLVLLALAWRWGLSLADVMTRPTGAPGYELDTISMSHFAEKARWSLDRLGVDYIERQSAGVLGVFLTGRTVPRLRFMTGRTRGSIGNSAEILRYLWGAHSADGNAGFLEPTPERLAWERRLDRFGVDMQVWVYYHILSDRELTLKLWGGDSTEIPAWQRHLSRLAFPLLAAFLRRSFGIGDRHYEKVIRRVDELNGDVEALLADGRPSILGEPEPTFVDLTFASLSALWVRPDDYTAGRADACIVPNDRLPAAMQADVARWREEYPLATRHIEQLYETERRTGTPALESGQTH